MAVNAQEPLGWGLFPLSHEAPGSLGEEAAQSPCAGWEPILARLTLPPSSPCGIRSLPLPSPHQPLLARQEAQPQPGLSRQTPVPQCGPGANLNLSQTFFSRFHLIILTNIALAGRLFAR